MNVKTMVILNVHSGDPYGSLLSTEVTDRNACFCLMSASLFYVLFAWSRDSTAVTRIGIRLFVYSE